MTPKRILSVEQQGIVLMVLSMAAFALADTLIKMASGTLSSAHTVLLLMGGASVIFTLMAKAQGHRLIDAVAVSPILLLRYAAEIIGTFAMVLALRDVPLSMVGAILQATPLVVAAGAVFFLGEAVSWRRWTAIGVGFFGVLLIVQPGTEGFEVHSLLAVLAMLSLSVRDLTTRVTPPGVASSSLASYTMLAATPVALVWVLMTQPTVLPDEANLWMVAGMISFGALGYFLITQSIRMAAVSVVSPFRYSRLLFLLLLGVLVFDERPDVWMLAGAVLIIASGLYTLWRERQLRRSLP